MYFNFALNLNMTLSSDDNPFKQYGPRSGPTFYLDLIGVKTLSGPTFCLDLIRDQTVWHFRGYDKLKLNRYVF